MLQGLETVEDEQDAAALKRLRDLLGFQWGAGAGVWETKLFQRPVEKAVGRGRPFLGALAVKGPSEQRLRPAPALASKLFDPLGNKCRLPLPAPGDDGENMDAGVVPGDVEPRSLLVAPAQRDERGVGQRGEVDEERRRFEIGFGGWRS